MAVGIYRIYFIGVAKSYIGGSANIEIRTSSHGHALKRNKSENKEMQDVYSNNPSLFRWEILEECSKADLGNPPNITTSNENDNNAATRGSMGN